jgi:hypothetical protein
LSRVTANVSPQIGHLLGVVYMLLCSSVSLSIGGNDLDAVTYMPHHLFTPIAHRL